MARTVDPEALERLNELKKSRNTRGTELTLKAAEASSGELGDDANERIVQWLRGLQAARTRKSKTVSATEAKNRLGAMIGDVAGDDFDVIIENHGRPRAALISYDAYREFLEVRDRQRRLDAMEDLRRLRAEVRARNQDLDEEAADQLIEEISSEVRARISARIRQNSAKRIGYESDLG